MVQAVRKLTHYQRFRIWLEFDVAWKWVIVVWFAAVAVFAATHQGHRSSDGAPSECHRGMNVTDDCDY
ncbi:hypothetical protein [Mesorhizobium sp. B2-3-4]|uniref:hypothetical protein n=1 Tax=Mesorhizobium sp. B2-3-4 TaxID=2589959 RepID=UPI00112BBC86|nr:hypothetical protein [Mesorhizobium sp. B2-3-4]TPM25716.1 hypothetical protein FJ967_32340 [Mesorhizobium sp. B2-3-4]